MIKKISYSVLLGIVLGLGALLVINYLEYDELKKENSKLNKNNSLIIKEKDTLELYLEQINSDYEKLQVEKKELIKEYESWKKRNQKIKDSL